MFYLLKKKKYKQTQSYGKPTKRMNVTTHNLQIKQEKNVTAQPIKMSNFIDKNDSFETQI